MRPFALVLALALAAAVWGANDARAVTLPPSFVAENVTPTATWTTPVAIAFLPGGRMLVAEKRGRVYSVVNGVKSASPLVSLDNEVLNTGDRGLLGLAVDPGYVTNHYVYLLYTVDPDSNGTDNNDDAFARLTRYQVSFADSNLFLASSRTILMGASWTQGPVSCSQSHTIGTLRFARDGSLLVGAGDGASFSYVDAGGSDPGAFGAGKTDTYEDIGAFRSQSLSSLAGKILRLNPANGHGYPSNPFYDGNENSKRSKIYAYGLRNPYRFCVRPGTGSTNPAAGDPGVICIGEVGYNRWEDFDVADTPGLNFGWPCYEGPDPRADYQAATPAHNGCGSFGTSDNPSSNTDPVSTWHHTDPALSVPTGFIGNAAVGGMWYTGTLYPAQWRNKYFMADYGQNWIKVFDMDASYDLISVIPFASAADAPVDFAPDPVTGDILYVSISTNQIRRIRYTGVLSNSPPTAAASAAPDVGVAPLQVTFSSAGSSDLDGDPMTFAWTFGDGQSAGGATALHTYTSPGSYDAVLTASDGQGGTGRDTVRVIVAATSSFPTTGVLDNFNRANGPIGGAWTDVTAGLVISSNQLAQQSGYATTVWNGGVFGADQEAYITFKATTASAPEHDLMLKVQGTSYANGHIEVRYDATVSSIQVSTHTPAGGWVPRGAPIPVTFAAGDRLGARAYSNGAIEVYKNGVRIGQTDAGDWPFAASGGRIGLTIGGATSSRLDDFGGGTYVLAVNTPPVATILAPADSSFYHEALVTLTGSGADTQDAPAALQYHWSVDLHHNNHVHPATVVADGANQSFLGENHDDGTGVWMRVNLQVTDSGALADTEFVDIFPELDLDPGPVVTLPSTPGTTAPATYTFRLRNHGRMPAPLTRWRLLAGGTLLAQGDTVVAALDSVTIVRTLSPALAAGTHTLRVVADTLGAVVETNETNNARTRTLVVVSGPGPDEYGPLFVEGPESEVSTTTAWIRWKTSERSNGVVRYGATPALGDSVAVSDYGLSHVGQMFGLAGGAKYWYRVLARDTLGNGTLSALDSLTTLPAGLDASGPPLRFALSNAFPNPSRASASLALDLAEGARVRFSVHDLQGREVWSEGARELGPGRFRLEWPGRAASGERARAGLYWAAVRVDGRTHLRRLVLTP